MDELSLAEKVGRNVVLACVLEPIPDKPGCTTRYVDIKPTKALELFVTAGVNSGPAFVHLVEYLERNQSPRGSYRFIKEAMVTSKFLRAGGKINQGMLEFLFPVVIANVLYDPFCHGEPHDILALTAGTLSATGPVDVQDLIEMKKIGNKMSGVETKFPVREHRVTTVYDYYRAEFELEKVQNRLNGVVHNGQFVEGFPDVGLALKVFLQSPEPKFAKRAKEAYEALFKREGYEDLGVGLAADFIAVVLYLVFMFASEDEEIIN